MRASESFSSPGFRAGIFSSRFSFASCSTDYAKEGTNLTLGQLFIGMKIRPYLSSYLGEIGETPTDRLFNKILGVIHVMVWPVDEFFSEEHSL